MCGKSVDVAAAGLTTRYLVQGVLIDARTVLGLEVSDIFRSNLFRHSAIERLDHALGLVQRSLPRRRYAQDIVPDIAVLELQRVSLYRHIGREGCLQEPLLIRKLYGDARGIAP